MKKTISLILTLVLLLNILPQTLLQINAAADPLEGLQGKTLSILGDSISTYADVSDGAAALTTNSTIGGNECFYSPGKYDIYRKDTWWQQAMDRLGLELLVNNSWSGSFLAWDHNGDSAACSDRCVNLHDDTGENAGQEPDLIAVAVGINDFWARPDTLGTAYEIDYDILIQSREDGYVYAKPKTSMEAYAIMLHRITERYPNAEVYCFTLFPLKGTQDRLVLENFDESIATVATRFGAHVVDLYNDSGMTNSVYYNRYFADAVHPNAGGMDALTGCFVSSVLENTKYLPADRVLYHVSYELTNVTVAEGTVKVVPAGDKLTINLLTNAETAPSVVVTMGGRDITAQCYADGMIYIPEVYGNISIHAVAGASVEKSYRWEYDGTELRPVTTYENRENSLLRKSGSIVDGVHSNTRYALTEQLCLLHDQPWTVEWQSEGDWNSAGKGALLFATDELSSMTNAPYLFRGTDLIALGYRSGGGYKNFGISLADYGIDSTQPHVYALTNRVSDDGSNMIYLSVDGMELGAMNRAYNGMEAQNTTLDWVNGKDFYFSYFGTAAHPIHRCSIDYIQVWEDGHVHAYTRQLVAPNCTEAGYTEYHCNACEKLERERFVAALGHAEHYINLDSRHFVMCQRCRNYRYEAHSYVDGLCACGASEGPLLDSSLGFLKISMNLQSYIGMNMVLNNAVVADYDSYTVKARIGDGAEESLQPIPLGKTLTYFEIRLAATQMTEKVYVTIYGQKGGKDYCSETIEWSVRDAITEQLDQPENPAHGTLMVDLLNYGAAAQTAFQYRTEDLANGTLTETQRAYGTTQIPSMSGELSQVPNENGTVTFRGTSVALESVITLQLMIHSGGLPADTLEARITYDGKTRIAALQPYIGAFYQISYEGLTACDLRTELSVTIFDKTTGNAVSNTLLCSVEALLAALEPSELTYAILRYGDAAQAFYNG